MEIFDDIYNSVAMSFRKRINDIILGPFISSWVLCNWGKLALLFFGTGTPDVRIKNMLQEMSVRNLLTYPGFLDLFFMPLTLTALYIFILPHLSYWVSEKVNPIKQKLEKQHDKFESETRKDMSKTELLGLRSVAASHGEKTKDIPRRR
ncbi:hypothetical protein BJAS_P4253 [Bathymodiolus japonicus methanotrophic gill symbiont]|uniref:hypothetical protein n=1 Tax=Bathymodiolus japonicus methanotrophic gill symbiont TaxID=113269 RepID=UPI001B68C089|nr:hypothetical protein [Bathymodiolus japonicus methanotrophic gill symbiont]GFO73339.1 hypothetical protein BJAS_P4096 [Bathymodiolus japonicus methanotrophic gill symbiont]GFO73442.1 hypothetical protein BJAS_P4253 [Bathymodiolus japonicus methanotrophic gill symbiont]